MDLRVKVITDALLSAAAAISQFNNKTMQATIKSTAGDVVTKADYASEKAITRTIVATFPHDSIISEESPEALNILGGSQAIITGWVIDPIDGSNNFSKGMAYSGISIGYIEAGIAVVGGVYDPYRRELYIALQGQGATRNGDKIHVSTKSIFDAGTRVCTSNSYEGGTLANLKRYQELGHVWVDVLGSAVLIMTDVASGRLDLYHHNGLKPWDNAATFLIASEAGAKITDLQGRPVNWLSSEVVMGNPVLVDSFIALTATR